MPFRAKNRKWNDDGLCLECGKPPAELYNANGSFRGFAARCRQHLNRAAKNQRDYNRKKKNEQRNSGLVD